MQSRASTLNCNIVSISQKNKRRKSKIQNVQNSMGLERKMGREIMGKRDYGGEIMARSRAEPFNTRERGHSANNLIQWATQPSKALCASDENFWEDIQNKAKIQEDDERRH